MRDHDEVQLPGPPSVRSTVGLIVMVAAVGIIVGVIPFNATALGVVLLLVSVAPVF